MRCIMNKKRVFISFDYDNDQDLKNLLVGQSHNPDSPFSIIDMSIKEPINNNWKENARRRIKGCDVVIVICGCNTDSATGVGIELEIAQDECIDYFLLRGYKNRKCVKPKNAKASDVVHEWTWYEIKKLIGGAK